MDRGAAPICRSASLGAIRSGVLEVLPGLDHLDSGKKPQGTILPYITIYFGHHIRGSTTRIAAYTNVCRYLAQSKFSSLRSFLQV